MNAGVVYVLTVTVEPWDDGGGDDYVEGAYMSISSALKAVMRLIHADYPGKRHNVTNTTKTPFGQYSTITVWDDDVPDYPLAYITIDPTPLED